MEKGRVQSTNSSSSSSSNSNGVAASPAQAPPLTPKSTPRSVDAASPYPTTFIQADAGSFKQVVQMWTGSSDTAAKHSAPLMPPPAPPLPAKSGISPAAKATGPKKQAFKLYERRGSLKNLKMISPMIPSCWNPSSPLGGASPRRHPPEILSPSVLDLLSLTLSPVTPLNPDPFRRSQPPNPPLAAAMSAEERAIAEKGFYLHPSPRTTPRDPDLPRLLPLFPLTSPRLSSTSASASSS